MIDEHTATRKAWAIGLQVIGTLGVLLLGKRAGLITTLKPLLDRLHEFNFHMSTDLYEQVIKDAGEAE